MYGASEEESMFASMNEIIPGLWLGDMEAADELEMLRDNKITHILVAGCNLQKLS